MYLSSCYTSKARFVIVLGGLPSFSSPRPPNHRAIPALAQSLSKDINYALPDNYMKGAGDTYFSGKMLAKLGRIIVVAQELRGLASTPDYDLPGDEDVLRIIRACKEASLPTEKEVMDAVGRLRSGVEVWRYLVYAVRMVAPYRIHWQWF